jgi:hypothetical protein
VPGILQSNKEWKQLESDFFKARGFRLIAKPIENEIEIAKKVDGDLYSFPYVTISETMQGFVFLLLALLNRGESHSGNLLQTGFQAHLRIRLSSFT